MSDYQTIYREHAAEYDALVDAEDVDGMLFPAIDGVASVAGATVLEVGAGTGRLSRLLAPAAKRFVGVEKEPAMLDRARLHLAALGLETPAELHVGDARSLPVGDDFADVAVAGWVLGHFRSWYADDWQAQIGAALREMDRALRPGGALVILETLGTGSEEPNPPNAGLAEYYAWLEEAHGMTRSVLRTDYRFPDVDAAARVTGFFFGDAFASRVRAETGAGKWIERSTEAAPGVRAVRIPECTGLWTRRAPARRVSQEAPPPRA